MKTIARYNFLTLFLLIGSLALQAQQGYIKINPKTLEQKGENLEIEMTFDMSNLYIRRVESRVYTPILVSTKHKKEIELPKVIIKGSRRYKADRRESALSGRPITTLQNQTQAQTQVSPMSIYAVEKFNKKNQIPYRASIAYKEWMEDASLDLREDVYACCGIPQRTTMHRNVFQEVGTPYDIRPKFSYVTPERESEKKRFEIGNAYLDFPQGKSVIDPTFRNNRQELNKINQLIVMIASDPDVSVQSIEMRGYASPESSQSYNYNLSSRRAQAMRDYFAHLTTRIPANYYQVGSGGEDWDGLRNLLIDYPVSYKSEILNIINTVDNWDTREQMIKNLGNGEPYRLIFRDLYPKLRRVDCQVNYIVRDFTIDEGKERIINKPKLLSQNEMYQIARTYPEGSNDFNQALITAQKHFPANDAANLNAAAVALSEKDIALAEDYLGQVKNTNLPEYANCMGVLAMLKGDFNVSEIYLKRAQAAGVTEATHNLHELQRARGQVPQASTNRNTPASTERKTTPVTPPVKKRVIIDGETYIPEKQE